MNKLPDEKVYEAIQLLIAENQDDSVYDFNNEREEAEQILTEQIETVKKLEQTNQELIQVVSLGNLRENSSRIEELKLLFKDFHTQYKKKISRLKDLQLMITVTYQVEKELSERHQFVNNKAEFLILSDALAEQDEKINQLELLVDGESDEIELDAETAIKTTEKKDML